MASDVTNRKVVRKALETLLEAELGNLVDKTFDHLVTDFGRKTDNSGPVEKALVVTSYNGGSQREKETVDTTSETVFYLSIASFVLCTFQTEATAEDALDDIEKAISDCLIDNATVPGSWALLILEDRSKVDAVPVVSLEFRREMFTVRVELYDD